MLPYTNTAWGLNVYEDTPPSEEDDLTRKDATDKIKNLKRNAGQMEFKEITGIIKKLRVDNILSSDSVETTMVKNLVYKMWQNDYQSTSLTGEEIERILPLIPPTEENLNKFLHRYKNAGKIFKCASTRMNDLYEHTRAKAERYQDQLRDATEFKKLVSELPPMDTASVQSTHDDDQDDRFERAQEFVSRFMPLPPSTPRQGQSPALSGSSGGLVRQFEQTSLGGVEESVDDMEQEGIEEIEQEAVEQYVTTGTVRSDVMIGHTDVDVEVVPVSRKKSSKKTTSK